MREGQGRQNTYFHEFQEVKNLSGPGVDEWLHRYVPQFFTIRKVSQGGTYSRLLFSTVPNYVTSNTKLQYNSNATEALPKTLL